MANAWAGNALVGEEQRRHRRPMGPAGVQGRRRPRHAWTSPVRVAFRPSVKKDPWLQKRASRLFGRGTKPDTPAQTHVELVIDFVCTGDACPLRGITRCGVRFEQAGSDSAKETRHEAGMVHRCSVMAVDSPYPQQMYMDRGYELEEAKWTFVELPVTPAQVASIIDDAILVVTQCNIASNTRAARKAMQWSRHHIGSIDSVIGKWIDEAARQIATALGFLTCTAADNLTDEQYHAATSAYPSVYFFLLHMQKRSARVICCGLLEAPRGDRTTTCGPCNLPRHRNFVTSTWASLVDRVFDFWVGMSTTCGMLSACCLYCTGAPNETAYNERGFFINTTGLSCSCSAARAADRLLKFPMCCCIATRRECCCVTPDTPRYELLVGDDDDAEHELLRPTQCAERTMSLLVRAGVLSPGDVGVTAVTPTSVYEDVLPLGTYLSELTEDGTWTRTELLRPGG